MVDLPRFWWVKQVVYYRIGRNLIGEIVPGVWEEAALVEKLGEGRMQTLIILKDVIQGPL